ncbi:MAG TPA: hypothetical protein VN713_04735 [Sphingomicrobium sp.]|nr:hypothetical protein [Sphingomicrobium sp.]
MDDPRQPDMFGSSPPQAEMFDAPAQVERKPIHSKRYGIIEPPPPGGHTPETIRAQMKKLISQARSAKATPWPLRQTRTHMVMFPYMAEWLSKEEGAQLLMEFKTEMRRLGHDEPPPLETC